MANFFDQFDSQGREIPPVGRQLLDAIAGGEAPDYNTIYGGRRFNDFTDHPRVAVPIQSGPNAGKTSSAAGRYQFLGSTWDEVAQEAGLPDFSPDSQDQGAWHLAQKTYRARTGRDLTPDLEASQGDPQGMSRIGQQLAGVWTSLPGGIEPNSATRGFGARAAQGGGEDNVQVANFFDKFDAPGAGPRTKSDAAPLPMVPAGPKNFFDQFDTGRPAAGAPSAPAAAAKPEAEGPGITGYAKESGKAALRGAVESAVSSRLKGAAVTPPSQGMNQFAFSPAELELADEEWRKSLKPGQIEASPLYRGGKALEDWMEATFGSNKQLHPLVEDVMAGFGSLAGNVAPMFLRGMGPAAIATTPMQGAGEAVDRAIKAKATPEQIARAGSLGNVSGATEFLDAMLPTLGSTGKIAGLIGKVGYKILAGAFIEGGQEGLQQFTQNLISRGIYNPKQDLTEDVAYNALVGAIVGGAAGPVLGHGPEAESKPATEAELAAAAGGPPPAVPPGPQVVAPAGPAPVVPTAPGGPPPVTPAMVPPVESRVQTDRSKGGVVIGAAGPLGRPTNVNVAGTADILPFVQPEPKIVAGVPVVPAVVEPPPSMPLPVEAPVPTAQVAPLRPARPEYQFKTAQGSIYTGFDNGTTIRDKAERQEHPGDTGVKEQSTKTVYLEPSAANRLGQGELPSWRYIDHGDGTMSLSSPNPVTGQWGIAPSQRAVKYWKQPGVGLVPLELWGSETIHGKPAYPKAHFGNQIIDIEIPPFSRPVPNVDIPSMVTSEAAMRIGGPTVVSPEGAAPVPPSAAGPAPQPPAAPAGAAPQVAPIEPSPPAPELREPITLPADHVEFMREEAKRLRLEEPPKSQEIVEGKAFDEGLGLPVENSPKPLKEEVETNPGADMERLADLLSQSLYGNMDNVTAVSVKEMFQNAFDAIKGFLERNTNEEGNISIDMNAVQRTVVVKDDGLGMPSSVMGNEFLQIAGTKKETKRASGGHGIAKMQFLYGSGKLRARSLRDGEYSELNTSGPELKEALRNKAAPRPKMTVRPATEQDLKLFPKGHGTVVEITIPDNYVDPSDGKTKDISFYPYVWEYNVLERSPLFDNINVKFNGDQLEMGTNFPLEKFTSLLNVKFDWGTARIYMEKEVNPATPGHNTHVLSNGLWQFTVPIRKDPGNPGEGSLPFTFYVDVDPRVTSGQPGYPFSLNRQEFSDEVKNDFANIFRHISLQYQSADLEQSSKNFGSMQYSDFDELSQKTALSPPQVIEPKLPPLKTPLTLVQPGDQGRIENGKLIINGRPTPELTPELIASYKGVDTSTLRVDQSEIDPKRGIVHDNVNVKVSSTETLPITEYITSRFGEHGVEFLHQISGLFIELRDVIVEAMPRPMLRTYGGAPPLMSNTNTYEGLGEWGVGVSFDIKYRGVSIMLPFKGMFVNPFLPIFPDNPVMAATGVTGTMVHESAHYKIREHGVAFENEMARINIVLNSHPTFNFYDFMQRMVNVYQNHWDVFQHMNGVFTNGLFPLEPRGKRFEDSSPEQAQDGSTSSAMAGAGGGTERGSQLSDWVTLSETVTPDEPGSTDNAFQVTRSRSRNPIDGGRAANTNAVRHIDPGLDAAPQQPENLTTAAGIHSVLAATGGAAPTNASVARGTGPTTGGGSAAGAGVGGTISQYQAHADRMNWYYKYFTGITELLDANPLFEPLRRYVERLFAMHNDETKIHDAALRIMKDWRALGDVQNKKLESFILDLQSMSYLTPAARSMALWRHPSPTEFAALVAKHGLNGEAVKVYTKIKVMGDTFLALNEANAIEEAQRRYHADPVKLAKRLDEIKALQRLARAQPFFPFTRFGRHFVVVKDSAGNVVHFETFEPKRFVGISLKRAEKYQAAKKAELQRKVPPGHVVETGILPETAEPFIGMPTLMLQQILDPANTIGLTPEQIQAAKLIQSMRNPAMALKDRAVYTTTTQTPGYSLDLRRSFARYYFHGGRYYAKMKHSWALRGHLAEATLAGTQGSNKAGGIASYMHDHFNNVVLNAKGDFGFFRGAIFLWAMGYVPAAATQNMTQTPMITLPFLAAKFNDARAAKELIQASAQLSTYYKRGKLEANAASSFEMAALSYGVKTGRITETQAGDLAAISAGGTLMSGQGGSRFQQEVIKFQEKAAFMFEMMEQFNRRVAFRAALRLAQRYPNKKFVKDSVRKYGREYDELSAEHGPAGAAAIVSAINAVDSTQYVYARYARPKIMRGPVGATLLVFKRYMQSTVNMLGHNKSDVLPRFLIMAMLMGGLGAVPGYEDMKHIFRAFGKWWFGKDLDPDRLVRQYVLQWFDGKVEPDLVLNGLARRGFGIPALVDMLGGAFTGRPGRGLAATKIDPVTGQRVANAAQNVPVPVLDRSRAISMGTILPAEIGKLFEPHDAPEKALADQIQKASGAVFSVGFNMIKAATDTHMESTDPKRWERAVPRAMGAASRAYRAYSEGRERAKGGPNSASTIVNYDVRDPEQMAEILAIGMGYQPLRVQAKWDNIMAHAESQAYIDLLRKTSLENYFEANRGGNKEEIAKARDAIIKFNQDRRDTGAGAQVITPDTLQRSIERRATQLQMKERGIPMQETKIPFSREIDKLFPEATIDVRRVR